VDPTYQWERGSGSRTSAIGRRGECCYRAVGLRLGELGWPKGKAHAQPTWEGKKEAGWLGGVGQNGGRRGARDFPLFFFLFQSFSNPISEKF